MNPQIISSMTKSEGVVGDEVESILTIMHVKNLFSDGVVVQTLTGIGIVASPSNLALAFLEFVSANTTRYTQEELVRVSSIIANIHQRHYKEKQEEK